MNEASAYICVVRHRIDASRCGAAEVTILLLFLVTEALSLESYWLPVTWSFVLDELIAG